MIPVRVPWFPEAAADGRFSFDEAGIFSVSITNKTYRRTFGLTRVLAFGWKYAWIPAKAGIQDAPTPIQSPQPRGKAPGFMIIKEKSGPIRQRRFPRRTRGKKVYGIRS